MRALTLKARICVFFSFIYLMKAAFVAATDSKTTIVAKNGSIEEGAYKYIYDDSMPNACDTVLFIGVGTAMNVNDYDNLSTEIVSGKSIVAIVSDHNPNFFVKLSAKKFARYYNQMVDSIQVLIPACEGREDPLIMVGAHSASGQAAITALPMLKHKPDGFVGLDPFQINVKKLKIDESIPTLDWGFAKTTCAVTIDKAAKAAYKISSNKNRIFYRVNNISRGIAHCVFTDKGCTFICGLKGDGGPVIPAVAHSIGIFVDAVKSGSFQKSDFALGYDDSFLELFANDDDPDSSMSIFLTDKIFAFFLNMLRWK